MDISELLLSGKLSGPESPTAARVECFANILIPSKISKPLAFLNGVNADQRISFCVSCCRKRTVVASPHQHQQSQQQQQQGRVSTKPPSVTNSSKLADTL